jgi:hypothetical protein
MNAPNPAQLERAAELAAGIPPGPWHHYRAHDGALILEDPTGEPLAHVYAGRALALYLEAVAPAVLFYVLEGG